MKVVLSPRAELDFEAQVRWLKEHSPDVGRRAATQIIETLNLLSDFPRLGVGVGQGVREKHIQFGRDGFVLRYRIKGQTLWVLRILHGRQAR
jgi:plasmid stabilization system protein ParE